MHNDYIMCMHDEQIGQLNTQVLFENSARDKLYEGIKIAAEAVSCTLGPKGKTVLIQGANNAPIVTKDGVTVSKSINLVDPIQRMGANLVREAASRTNEVAGDGTTTATALAYAIISEGKKLMAAEHDPRELRDGMSFGVQKVIEHVKSQSLKLTTTDEVIHVATISANGDESIGRIVASAFEKVGADGVITVDDAKSMHTTLEVVEGMQLDRGYLSPYFVTNSEKMNAMYTDCYVLVTDRKIATMQDIIGVLEFIHKSGKALLIIADDVEGEALQALVLNRVKANLNVVAIKAPGYGQLRDAMLGDICSLTGAKLVSSATGTKLQDAGNHETLGMCKKIVVDQKSTILVGLSTASENVKTRVEELKSQVSDPSLEAEQIAHLKQRIARLAGGVAVIKVGGVTEIEMIERKYRIEDALNATRAAMEEGIVLGGGCALFAASTHLMDLMSPTGTLSYNAGYKAIMNACIEPLSKIVRNAGKSDKVVIDKLCEKRQIDKRVGYNAATDTYVDMFSSGIVDPLKVTRTALENAQSVALLFISLGAVVVNEEKDGNTQ